MAKKRRDKSKMSSQLSAGSAPLLERAGPKACSNSFKRKNAVEVELCSGFEAHYVTFTRIPHSTRPSAYAPASLRDPCRRNVGRAKKLAGTSGLRCPVLMLTKKN